MRVFVAGASGALGRRLVPALVARRHEVVATTRTPEKMDLVMALGARGVLLDALDEEAVGSAVVEAAPDVIIHQMTALSGSPDFRRFDQWFATTNELRTKGTDHLLAAAVAADVDRFVAQSYIGWNNTRTGGPVTDEADGLDNDPLEAQAETAAAIRYVDETVTSQDSLQGIALRYGNFYGPHASDSLIELVRKRRFPVIGNGAGIWSWIHLDDAAAATVAAVERGRSGVYNIVDDDPAPVSEWLPYLAEAVGAKPPMHLPVWLARLGSGPVPVRWMTESRGASNAKAKKELDWRPAWPSWREGFRHGLNIAEVPTGK